MPVEFLSDEQIAAYGRFTGELSAGELERFFYLDDADRDLVARRRSDHRRLGFAVQLGTVRAVGRFLEDPLDVPWLAVELLADELPALMAEVRLYAALAAAARSADPSLPERLANLLRVPGGSRFSELERLRRAPRRSSGPEMVKALQRAEQLAALGSAVSRWTTSRSIGCRCWPVPVWGARLRRWRGWVSRSGPRR